MYYYCHYYLISPSAPPCISHLTASMSAALVSACSIQVTDWCPRDNKTYCKEDGQDPPGMHGCSGEGAQLAGGHRGIWGLELLLKCKYDGAALSFPEWLDGE